MAVCIALLIGIAAGSVVGWGVGRAYGTEQARDALRAQQRRGDYWFNEYRNATQEAAK